MGIYIQPQFDKTVSRGKLKATGILINSGGDFDKVFTSVLRDLPRYYPLLMMILVCILVLIGFRGLQKFPARKVHSNVVTHIAHGYCIFQLTSNSGKWIQNQDHIVPTVSLHVLLVVSAGLAVQADLGNVCYAEHMIRSAFGRKRDGR